MSSRPRPTSSVPKAPVQAYSSSTLSEKAVLSGTQTISVGAGAVVQPHARIVSAYSRVSIGAGCILSERSRTGHVEAPADAVADSLPSLDVTLGANVVLEPGASVAAMEVGEGSVIGAHASVGAGCVLGKHCRVAPRCWIEPGTLLPDYSVVYGDGAYGGPAGGAGVEGGGEGGGEGGVVGGSGRMPAAALRRQGRGTEQLRRLAHEKQIDALRRLVKSDFAKHGAIIVDADGPVDGQ